MIYRTREGRPSIVATVGVVVLLILATFGSLALDWAARHHRPASVSEGQVLIPPPPGLLPDATLVSDPTQLARLTGEEAQRRNAEIAATPDAIDPAQPFRTAGISSVDRNRALDCLTAAVYYEAASESDVGQRAVAQVVLNRARHTAFPHTVCGVVFQGADRATGCQFSFTCDGSLNRPPSVRGWARARNAAAAVYGGYVERSVGLATHYHTVSVLPLWSPKLVKLVTLGAHIFLRWPGDWGRQVAFNTRYTGGEPAVGDAAGSLASDEPALADVISNATAADNPLPKQWDRPLLRPETADAPARSTAQPAVGVDERRILGIDPPTAARPDQKSPAGTTPQ
ncbi:MAG: cell wall hydrolase [Sphingomonas bacterium]|nr:cell wall hydrolase [Sphingomonas bacterium]